MSIRPRADTKCRRPLAESSSDGDSESDFEVEANSDLREELSLMPLSKVREMKEKLGVKLFNKIYLGETSSRSKDTPEEKLPHLKTVEKRKRESAKRPREESSKKPVSKRRNIFANERIVRKRIDPRFDDRYGKFDEFVYDRNYKFIEDMKEEETEVLKKEMAEAKANGNTDRAVRLKQALKKRDDQKRAKVLREEHKQTMRELRKGNIERMKQGLKPVFKTKSEVKMMEMEKKFARLKKEHRLESYLEKKEKKSSKKAARKQLPEHS